MALGSSPPHKEDDTYRWAQEYLLDPLNAVEAYQTAQTGGQYNDQIPTQHKTLTVEQYLAASKPSGSSGLGRSRSLLSRSGSKKQKKEADEAKAPEATAGTQVRRSTSIRDKLMRRFTDDGKDPDKRQRPLRPLNEVSDKEISRMSNTTVPPRGANRAPRLLTPAAAAPEKTPDVQSQQDSNDLQNQENRPVSKRAEDRWSNNPYREALLDAENRENRSPPGSPSQTINRSPTNPFRREGLAPSHVHSPPRHHSRSVQPHRSVQRSEGPRAPLRPHSRQDVKKRPQTQKVLAADTIDSLDTSFGILTFHHEGPYDATLSHRNRNPMRSPVQATKYGNAMALRATAPEDIQNSLQFGRPLEGVAAFPPGTHVTGGVLEYEEYDLNRKDGNFRRYPGERYRDEDLKGKGIEGYDGDLAAKKSKEAKHRRGKSLDTATGNSADVLTSLNPVTSAVRRNGSTGGRLEGAAAKIKRTFSLKRREKKVDAA